MTFICAFDSTQDQSDVVWEMNVWAGYAVMEWNDILYFKIKFC